MATRSTAAKAAENRPIRVGDRVVVDHRKCPGIWTVDKVNRSSFGINQGGRAVNAPREMVRLATNADELAAPPAEEWLPAGTVVKHAGRRGYFVVIRENGDSISVAPLGGDSGRYVRSRRAYLTKVNGHFEEEL